LAIVVGANAYCPSTEEKFLHRVAISRVETMSGKAHGINVRLKLSYHGRKYRKFIARNENKCYSNLFIQPLFTKKTRRFWKRKNSKL